MKDLEQFIIELNEEDRKILPKWRVKSIDLLNQKIKKTLMKYQADKLGYDSSLSDHRAYKN